MPDDFEHDHIQHDVKKYPNAQVVWCQEEAKVSYPPFCPYLTLPFFPI